MTSKQVPASECYFQAEVEVKDRKNETDRSTPFSAVARTGDALNHPYWGRVVHDLEGMRVKSRIPIDWNHSDTLVGYANKFDTDSGDLNISGALTPTEFDQTQRAQQIIDQAEQGVPFEMSISFPGDLTLEEVPESQQVEVNQRTFSGPLTVIRSWPLRAVAITPMGQDAQTALQFSEDQQVTVTYLETDMSESENIAAEAEVEVKDEIEAVDESVNDTVEAEAPEVDAVEAESKTEEPELVNLSSAQDYMSRFGRVQGALYFADGLSLEEATAKELERLQQENAELRTRKPVDDGEEEPTGFSGAGNMESNVLTAVPGEVCDQVIRPK